MARWLQLTLFGADWCPDCRRSKRLLDRVGVAYTWRDTEHDEDALAELLGLNGGRQSIPVLVFPDGHHVTEPSDPHLRAELVRAGLLADDPPDDTI